MTTFETKLLTGEISKLEYALAKGLTEEQFDNLFLFNIEHDSIARSVFNITDYGKLVSDMSKAISNKLKEIENRHVTTPQARNKQDKDISITILDSELLARISKNFLHPFNNNYLDKFSPYLKQRFNKRFDNVQTGEKALKEYRHKVYNEQCQYIINELNKVTN